MRIWAGMATLSERADICALAAASIIPQVDRLIVAHGDDRGDQAKFLACAEAPDDVVFIGVDDDLIYPADYVENLVAGLERHPGSIVSFHGWKMDESGECYVENFRCLENVWDDVEVHVAGTGVCAFEIATVRPLMSDFESVIADLWLSLRAQEQGIARFVLSHPSFWLGYVQKPMARTLYTHTRYKTGTSLDGSAGFERAVLRLRDLIYDGEPVAA